MYYLKCRTLLIALKLLVIFQLTNSQEDHLDLNDQTVAPRVYATQVKHSINTFTHIYTHLIFDTHTSLFNINTD